MEKTTIIAATDFSDNANHAVEFAADFAMSINAKLVIFNSVSVQPLLYDDAMPLTLWDDMKHSSNSYLLHVKEEMIRHSKGQLRIDTREEVGLVDHELQHLCMQEKPFAIFISSHLTSIPEKILIGTHSIKIAKNNYAPVIIIPESANFKPVRKIGIAVDIKDKDEFPFEVLKERLKYLRSEIEIVYIRRNYDALCKNDVADLLDKLPGFNPKLRVIENKNTAQGIDEYVKDYAPDLLVMYSKKHGLFHKSTSNPFILQPRVPTMIITQTSK